MRKAGVAVGVGIFAALVWLAVRGVPDGAAPPGPRSAPPAEGDVVPPAVSDAAGGEAAAALEAGYCTIDGVVLRDDVPVAAEVEARPWSWRGPEGLQRAAHIDRLQSPFADAAPVPRTAAGENGRFLLTGLAPGGYVIVARAADGAAGRQRLGVSLLMPAASTEVWITGGRERLAGRAEWSDGGPFRGTVWATTEVHRYASLIRRSGGADPTETDEAGRFVLEGLAAGPHTLSLLEPGRFLVEVSGVLVPQLGEYVVIVDEHFLDVPGQVVDAADGSPVAGARIVVAGKAEDQSTSALAFSDAEGRFVVRLPDGRGGVFVLADGYLTEKVRPKTPVTKLLIALTKLAPRGRIAGRVVTGDGGPAAGATVHAGPTHGRASEARADQAGRFAIENVAPGEVEVRVLGGGWATVGDAVKATVPPGGTAEVKIVAVPAGRAEGCVVDAEGAPVPGAIVLASDQRIFGAPLSAAAAARTGADGRFRIDDLQPGVEYWFDAVEGGRRADTLGPFVPASGEAADVVLTLAATRAFEVRVVEKTTREPLPGARITVYRTRGKPHHSDWHTGLDGTARVGPVPAGALAIDVDHDDCVRRMAWIPVPAEGPLEVELVRGLSIEGRLVADPPDLLGKLLFSVEARRSGSDLDGLYSRASASAPPPDRAFLLTRLAPGNYDVTVQAMTMGGGSKTVGTARAAAGDRGVVIRVELPDEPVEPARELTVRVVGPDGEPVASGRLRSSFSDGRGRDDELRDGGRTVGIRPGASLLWLVVAEARDAAGAALGPAALRSPSLDDPELTIRLPPGGAIDGTVLDAAGKPAPRVDVVAAPLEPEVWEKRADLGPSARTDADGRFRMEGLGDWNYELTVHRPAGHVGVTPVEARAGKTDVLLRLPGEETVVVRVLDSDGRPVLGASVGVFAAGTWDPVTAARTDGQGEVRLVGLTASVPRRLYIQPPRANEDLAIHDEDPWTPKDTVVRLAPGGTIRGFVRDASGAPVGDASVWTRAESGKWYVSGEVSSDGSFVVRELKGGPVALRATPAGGAWDEAGVEEVVAKAGTTGVILRTYSGLGLTVRMKNLPPGAIASAELVSETRPGVTRRAVRPVNDVRRFAGLLPGENWTLRIAGAGGLSLEKKGVRSDAGDLAVDLVAGVEIRGRIVAPDGATRLGVSASAGQLSVRGIVEPDGRLVVTGLLPGRWKVRAYARVGRDPWRTEVEADAPGEDVEIRLRPKEDK